MSSAVEVGGLALGPSASLSSARAASGKLTNVQLLRAFAASAVALMHGALIIEEARGLSTATWLKPLNLHLGIFGVAMFFVISGWLMSQLVRANDPRTFLAHRVLRLYPVYLVATVLSFVGWRLAGFELTNDWVPLTLAPTGKRSPVLGGVDWTLVHETAFYVVLFLLASCGLARRLEALAALWLALLVLVNFYGSELGLPAPQSLIHTLLLVDVNVGFAVGLLLPWAIEKRLLPPLPCLAIGVPLAFLLVWTEVSHARWWLSILSAFIVAGAVQLPQVSTKNWLSFGFVRLGDWSYGLYLIHMPICVVLMQLVPDTMPTGLVFVTMVACSLAASAALGPLDITLYRRLRRAADRLGPKRVGAAVWAFALLYLMVGTVMAIRVTGQDREAEQARATIGRLPPGSLTDGASLTAGVAAAGLTAPSSFVGEIDRIDSLRKGAMVVVGWAVDLGQPKHTVHLALVCDGHVAALAAPKRYRADVSGRLGARDLRWVRIGFTAPLSGSACSPGAQIQPIFVAGGRLLVKPPLDSPHALP